MVARRAEQNIRAITLRNNSQIACPLAPRQTHLAVIGAGTFLQIDGRVLGAYSLGCWCRCCFVMLFGALVMVRVHFCKLDDRCSGSAVWRTVAIDGRAGGG